MLADLKQKVASGRSGKSHGRWMGRVFSQAKRRQAKKESCLLLVASNPMNQWTYQTQSLTCICFFGTFKLADRRCDGPGLNRLPILGIFLPLQRTSFGEFKTILERLDSVSFVWLCSSWKASLEEYFSTF